LFEPIHLPGELTVTYPAVKPNFLFVTVVKDWLRGCEDALKHAILICGASGDQAAMFRGIQILSF